MDRVGWTEVGLPSVAVVVVVDEVPAGQGV